MNVVLFLCFAPFVPIPNNSHIWRHGGHVGLSRQRNGSNIGKLVGFINMKTKDYTKDFQRGQKRYE